MKPGAHGTDLAELAEYLINTGPKKTQATSRRVRVIHNHAVIADTTRALHVWEHVAYPQYYIPREDVRNCMMQNRQEIRTGKGVVGAATVQLAVPSPDGRGEVCTDRVIRFADDEHLGVLAGMVRLEFGSMDQWLEEDSPIYVHPKDPFKRIDILPSQRPIEIKVLGKVVAKSSSSMHLIETGLPTRYYLPLASVDQSVLRKSSLITKCPYKGEAEYYHVVVDGQEMQDLVWYYRFSTQESAAVAGLVCFYNEKVDVVLDGELQPKPKSPFS